MNATSKAFLTMDTAAPKQNPALPGAGRILLVDDEKDSRQYVMEVLTAAGYLVEDYENGAAGWKALQANNYDLVVTDNKMPQMTGIEMIEKLRSARMAIPVILATGTSPVHEFVRKPWLKPDAILQKPFSSEQLLETVRKVLAADGGNESGNGAPRPPRP